MVLVYANAVKLIFFSQRDFKSNGMSQLKGFIVKTLDIHLHFGHLLQGEGMHSLVPKERHVRKEGHGCTLRLCIGCNERHDSPFGQSIDPEERHV